METAKLKPVATLSPNGCNGLSADPAEVTVQRPRLCSRHPANTHGRPCCAHPPFAAIVAVVRLAAIIPLQVS